MVAYRPGTMAVDLGVRPYHSPGAARWPHRTARKAYLGNTSPATIRLVGREDPVYELEADRGQGHLVPIGPTGMEKASLSGESAPKKFPTTLP